MNVNDQGAKVSINGYDPANLMCVAYRQQTAAEEVLAALRTEPRSVWEPCPHCGQGCASLAHSGFVVVACSQAACKAKIVGDFKFMTEIIALNRIGRK